MTIERAREIMGRRLEGKTDAQVQAMLDRLAPLVRLCVEKAEEEFGLLEPLDSYNSISNTGSRVQQKVHCNNGFCGSSEPAESTQRPFLHSEGQTT